ncbi:GNAT family N-acetyltransferase [Salsuginibacillus kocurii]|uniref:GNAT family N-acetyltransferase n=1 Tax=Salsuginibacillus kocurii TaxID=427078 RepID=UPI000365484A|nr:GNAT family N-acetyltransferase [Salsuginibacillus kocurii]
MEIRYARNDDLNGITRLFNLYREFYQQPTDEEGAREFLAERLEQQDSIIIVAKDLDKYIGFTQLYPTYSSISMSKDLILNDLYVDKEARGQGAGELLIKEAITYAQKLNAASLSLSTATNNISAQALYEKMGFVKDVDFYHYELALA